MFGIIWIFFVRMNEGGLVIPLEGVDDNSYMYDEWHNLAIRNMSTFADTKYSVLAYQDP